MLKDNKRLQPFGSSGRTICGCREPTEAQASTAHLRERQHTPERSSGTPKTEPNTSSQEISSRPPDSREASGLKATRLVFFAPAARNSVCPAIVDSLCFAGQPSSHSSQ